MIPLPGTHVRLLISVTLMAITFVAFSGSLGNDFINLDDNIYVTDNPVVQRGVTSEGVNWAFTTGHATNWHPVTWLSHMLDVELYGTTPSGHHLTGVLFHVVNTGLFAYALFLLTGAWWRSVVVAALFALHPLHVESVTWVAERKDVLSTFFFLLTLIAYARYVKRPGPAAYVLMLVVFGLGLLSKPMLVTMPFLLLLLDYWPLNRLEPGAGRKLILEKVPLMAMAVTSSAITYIVQSGGGATTETAVLPLGIRAANAALAFLNYLAHTVWPVDLAVFYPHPGMGTSIPGGAAAGLVILLVTIAVIRIRRDRPYLGVGWLWYVGMLMPVVGLIQVGGQSMADRYTYVPLTGVFIAVVWFAGSLVRTRDQVWTATAATAVILVLLPFLTVQQVGRWKNSITLFEHTVAVTGPNWMAEQNLGFAYGNAGRHDDAVTRYRNALAIRPELHEVHRGLGISLSHLGRNDEAIGEYRRALELNPLYDAAHYNLAALLAEMGRLEEAVTHYREAVRLNPGEIRAHNNLGVALAMLGREQEALDHFLSALRLHPDNAGLENNTANMLDQMGRRDEAVQHWRSALRIDPGHTEARRNLDRAVAEQAGQN